MRKYQDDISKSILKSAAGQLGGPIKRLLGYFNLDRRRFQMRKSAAGQKQR
jgi:hypothetical protein